MEQTHCTFRLGCGEGPAQDTAAETHPPPGVSPTAARQRARETHLSNTSTRRPPQSPPSICPRLISHGPGFKHSPPVRLKEFPKAENELRGVKSGLLGLLTGLHRPELSVGREEDNTQECDGPWRQIHRSQLRTAGPASARARYRQQGNCRPLHATEGPELRPLCHRLGAWLRASILWRKEVFLPCLPFSDGRFSKLFQI